MILILPISPEVPKRHRPRIWQALMFVLLLLLVFLGTETVFQQDLEHIAPLISEHDTQPIPRAQRFRLLQKRPLNIIAPSYEDWDLKRLLMANFLHSDIVHLGANLVGVFAGVRILSGFIPFGCTIAIFILGGTVGIFGSLLLTMHSAAFIPHLGASAGIFSLLGAYLIYNLKFRTVYFYWFPGRHRLISLPTVWSFILDGILLEIVLSSSQLFPSTNGQVDHLAHVGGFVAGVSLALLLKSLQHWPSYLQTRSEFRYWRQLPPLEKTIAHIPTVTSLLSINWFNDQLKLQIIRCVIIYLQTQKSVNMNEFFKWFRPTFVRLHTQDLAVLIQQMDHAGIKIPQRWLSHLPFDLAIKLCRILISQKASPSVLVNLMLQYQATHPLGKNAESYLSRLVQELKLHTDEIGSIDAKNAKA